MSNEELVQKIQHGHDSGGRLMLQLYNQNLPLIRKTARPYSAHIEMEDLLQEAYIGLSIAVDLWEPGRASFITYALYWIRNSFRECREHCGESCVRIPRHIWEKLGKYRVAVSLFVKEHGREPVPAELAAMMGITLAEVEQLRAADRIRRPGSLDVPLPGLDDEDITLSDTVEDPSRPFEDADDRIAIEQLKRDLSNAMSAMPELVAQALTEYYINSVTYKECAERLNIAEWKARDYVARGLRILRNKKELRVWRQDDSRVYNAGLHGTGFHAFNRTWTSATERAALVGM